MALLINDILFANRRPKDCHISEIPTNIHNVTEACFMHNEAVHMNFDEYDDDIKEWIGLVLANHSVNQDITKQNCKKILRIGVKNSDSKLLGFAYFYMAHINHLENDSRKLIRNLTLGMEHHNKAQMWDLLVRSYNLLGINFDNHGNIPAAIDYYLSAIKYCHEYGRNYEEGYANTNIGQLYFLLHDYETAISYLKEAHKCISSNKKEKSYSRIIVVIEISLGYCYLRKGNMKSALPYYYRIEKADHTNLGDVYNISICCFEVIFSDALAEFRKRDKLIGRMIELLDEAGSLVDVYDDVFMFCDFLYDVGRYEELMHVLERIEALTKPAGLTNMLLRVTRQKIKYYRTLHNEAAYLQAYTDYFLLSEQVADENIAITKESIDLRMDMERVKEKQILIQRENEILQNKSERDPLTGLPNRNKLNDYSEIAFENAYKKSTKFAIEILDIDCFKQYNDTYGHQAGDECLIKIAHLLHSLIERGIFCARYGGDEFTIIYENKTDEEIRGIAGKLKEDVFALNMANKSSTVLPVVTISQGICNTVPQKDNRIWDYLYSADMALYHVKRTEKNNIGFINGKPAPEE